MNEQSKILELFIRYFLIILIGLNNFYILYIFLTPLTVYVTNTALSVFTATSLVGNAIYINGLIIEIIPACVAGAAFYLLLILALSTADISLKTRFKVIATTFAIFFVLNIARILILVQITNTPHFEIIHWIFWHLISTVFVVGTWFAVVKLYKIESIPIYSDIKYLLSLIKSIKKSKRKKKHK
jgi:exosortase/archaeosortase family protein